MFDKLKAMGAIAGLMKNQDGLKAAGQRIRERLARTRVAGESLGGAVRAMVTGEMQVESIEIAPGVLAGLGGADGALAARAITDAVNDGLKRAREAMRDAVTAEAKALGLEDLPLGGLLP